jgi:ABC-type molybdate transport system permease subunit
MGIQIYFKIAGWVDLAVLMIFTPYLISVFINGFELLPKNLHKFASTEKDHIISHK